MQQFKLVCMNCGNEIIIDKNMFLTNVTRADEKFYIFEDIDNVIEIKCECGNKVIQK